MNENLSETLRPREQRVVRELVEAAGIDVSDWAFDRNHLPIQNPNQNVYRSFQWSFGGGGQPTALCVWHEEIDWASDQPTWAASTKRQDELNALADKAVSSDVRQRLGIKIRRLRDFQNAVFEAFKRKGPVRVILLAGKRSALEDAADDSSKVSARLLDPEPWYVHAFDPYQGEYRLVRGLEPPPRTVLDPFDGLVDPGLDPVLQDFVESLEDTEREAMIKSRVGQGPFRGALIARWKGCSVTGCSALDLLVASHIKPWSRCTTPAERLGAANGLLLVPNLDKLFDRGLVSFDSQFRIRISPALKPGTAMQLNVDRNLRLRSEAQPDILPFLAWHGEHVFVSS